MTYEAWDLLPLLKRLRSRIDDKKLEDSAEKVIRELEIEQEEYERWLEERAEEAQRMEAMEEGLPIF